jgi:hypothetical protein
MSRFALSALVRCEPSSLRKASAATRCASSSARSVAVLARAASRAAWASATAAAPAPARTVAPRGGARRRGLRFSGRDSGEIQDEALERRLGIGIRQGVLERGEPDVELGAQPVELARAAASA